MKIVKIRIENESCYGLLVDSYKETLILEEGLVSYRYEPEVPSEYNYQREWEYKTNSKDAAKLFAGFTDLYQVRDSFTVVHATDKLPKVITFFFDDGGSDIFETCDLSSMGSFELLLRMLLPQTDFMPLCIRECEDVIDDDENV